MDIYDNAKKSILLLSQIQADDQPCDISTKSEMWEGYSRQDIDLSDFELKEFEIIDIFPDPCRGFICFPMLHIMIMGKRKEGSPIIPSVEIDFLGIVSEFGFFDETDEIRQKILKGLTNKNESHYINKFMNIVKNGPWEKGGNGSHGCICP